MAGESQQAPRSGPDPTVLTTQQLERGLDAERDYVMGEVRVLEERLHGMDKATSLLSETVNRVPTDMQVAIGNLKELHNERFSSIETQFAERDTRQERESRDNKVAVDAAFAAQKEAASEQNKSNTLAIDKSERQQVDAIAKQADLNKSKTDAIDTQVNDLKERLTVLETARRTENTGTDQKRLDLGVLISVAAVFVAIISVIVVVLLAIKPA